MILVMSLAEMDRISEFQLEYSPASLRIEQFEILTIFFQRARRRINRNERELPVMMFASGIVSGKISGDTAIYHTA